MKIQYLVYGFWCNVYIRVGELYKFQSSAIYRLFTHTVQDTTPIRKRIYTRLYSYTGDFSWQFKLATWLRVYNYVKNKHVRAETIAYLEVVSNK
jgi:hypothetical protein